MTVSSRPVTKRPKIIGRSRVSTMRTAFGALPPAVKDLVRKQWAEVKDAAGKQVAYK